MVEINKLFWGIITYKSGTKEGIVATSEEAYYAYEIFYEGSRVSMPNYGDIDDLIDFDREMLSEINYQKTEEYKEAKLQEEIDDLKRREVILSKLSNEEKVSKILESFDL